MGESSRYASPEAARRAVTDKLKIQAPHSPWALADLQRQYAYDQLIERLYRVDGGWVIKVGARLPGSGSRRAQAAAHPGRARPAGPQGLGAAHH